AIRLPTCESADRGLLASAQGDGDSLGRYYESIPLRGILRYAYECCRTQESPDASQPYRRPSRRRPTDDRRRSLLRRHPASDRGDPLGARQFGRGIADAPPGVLCHRAWERERTCLRKAVDE